MDRLPTSRSPGETSLSPGFAADGTPLGADQPRVTVRYWASIKAAAGTASDEVEGRTLAEVLAGLRAIHQENPGFEAVLGVCSVLVDERPMGRADPRLVDFEDGAVVDLLPPFAGGAS